MQAIWKPVKGFENYSVSSTGEVRREKSPFCRNQRPVKQYKDRKGYMYVCLTSPGKRGTLRVHRIVAEAFIGSRDGLTVNHIDLDKTNNNVKNLELMTSAENTRHAIANGHKSLGQAKITEADAINIRNEKSNGTTRTALSERYGVTKRTIDRIVSFKSWKPIIATSLHQQHAEQ